MSDVLSPAKQSLTPANLVAVMDQYAEAPAHSPIFDNLKHHVVKPTTNKSGVVMKELALMGHLIIRGNAENAAFVEGVSRVLGLALPTKPLTAETNDVTSILWLSPDEWLVLSSADMIYDIEVALREKLTGHFSIVNQSGGQTVIELTGVNVLDVLKKSTSLDVHPTVFPVGKVVGSLLAKSSATYYHCGENQWRLIVRRSFADYIWRWLMDAGKEFGLVIEK
ncbi:sarcosine oxidase subunit gamma [Vibrio porteresiae]|uniref:Sarcosine oxidase subunit gamma family protein n=1 Tax=Vibrio porteresiae DSM 19223 TaxID=1123496 RepID=A0ABZ0QJF7_9VIBR|nr:sarcosine oxidase subunit gamma family protein [Vibrio porteresiae]WPC75573.1 sarcosine oxidase subunit gamma family protein [Vibrio porteresiae DSM 19223]